jgi:hypothetical protein
MPYNPLERFQPAMIPGFIKMGHPFLVAQYYPRGAHTLEPTKHPLLLMDYASAAVARDHVGSIPPDPWAACIHLENPVHRATLEEMAAADRPYLLYVSFVRDKASVNVRNDRYLAEAVRQYISQETAWSPELGDVIRPVLELNLGELFLRIAYHGQVLKEKLSVFEQKISGTCVTTSPLPPPSEPYRIIFQSSLSTFR